MATFEGFLDWFYDLLTGGDEPTEPSSEETTEPAKIARNISRAMQREDIALGVCAAGGLVAYFVGYHDVGAGLFGLGGLLKAVIPAKKTAPS